jgi:uncharacterized membrane protein YkoI
MNSKMNRKIFFILGIFLILVLAAGRLYASPDDSNDGLNDDINDDLYDDSRNESDDESNDDSGDDSNDGLNDDINDDLYDDSRNESDDESNDDSGDDSNDGLNDDINDDLYDDSAPVGSMPVAVTENMARLIASGENMGTVLEAKLENDGGITIWKVKITENGKDVEYSIDANTGNVLRSDSPASGSSADDSTDDSSDDKNLQYSRITREQALETAQEKLKGNITEAALEKDGDSYVWKVKDSEGREISVDAETGKRVPQTFFQSVLSIFGLF